MPPQNGVGGDDRGDLTQQPTAESVRAPRQPASVLISQPETSSAQLRSEDRAFFQSDTRRPPAAGRSHQPAKATSKSRSAAMT
jgi:hypothetical protein